MKIALSMSAFVGVFMLGCSTVDAPARLTPCRNSAGLFEADLIVKSIREKAVVIDLVDGLSTSPSGIDFVLGCGINGKAHSGTLLFYDRPLMGGREVAQGDVLAVAFESGFLDSDLCFVDEFVEGERDILIWRAPGSAGVGK